MKLRRIHVAQLRQFRRSVDIDGLSDGINLFIGPNESGKSTLVRAVRAAFLERHKSTSVKDLQPWGDSAAEPTVSLEFDWAGERWRLEKSFLRRKRCDLRVGSRVFSGEEAEQMLAELLGFRFPGSGSSRPELWGIPGLLWIEQGSAPDVDQAVGHAGDHLKSALGASLSEVASSAGDEVLAWVERERTALLTPSTGRPSGEYRLAIDEHERQRGALAELDANLASYRQQVDRLAELLERQRGDLARPWDEFRRQAAIAAGRLADVQRWQGEQEHARQELNTCLQSQDLCREQLQAFRDQEVELRGRQQAQEQAVRQLQELRLRQPLIEERLGRVRAADEQARAAQRAALSSERRGQLGREIARCSTAVSIGEESLRRASVVQAELLRLREELQSVQLDARDLEALRKYSREIEDLQLRQHATATRLRFELLPGRSVTLGEESLSGEGERLLLEPVRLRLDGVGELHIQPGGEDLARLAHERRRLEDVLGMALAALAVASVAEAEARLERTQLLRHEITRSELQLDACAPDGIAALQQQVQLERSRITDLQLKLDELPSPTGEPLDASIAQHHVERMAEELGVAQRGAEESRRSLDLAEHAFSRAQEECRRVLALVGASDRLERQDRTQRRLGDLLATESLLRQGIANRQRDIDAEQPQLLEQDRQRLSASADALEGEARTRMHEIVRLQGILETQGALGLEETRADTLQKFEHSLRRRTELERRAQALDLLLELLRTKRRQLTERLQAPLQHHLAHYLQLLFPRASLEVDVNLVPRTLLRQVNGSDEPGAVEELSFGAREQTGLISRLAYADLLREAGRPTLIILDDALVHTDRERLAQMKRILFDAAERHQILLFSCHPENWRDLGVAAREMSAL